MSKADEKSKQYRDFREECGIKDPIMLDEIDEAYYEGYLQAEKDLELTWEDVKAIFLLVQVEWRPNKNEEEIYQEVLKRFNIERKEK